MRLLSLFLLLSLNLSLLPLPQTKAAQLDCGEGQCDNPDTVFDGFFWHGVWVPGYPSLDSWMEPTPDYYWGRAVYYSPGVMEATADYHSLSLEGYVDGVASMACGDIGEDVWLQGPEGWEGPFLVVDCPMRGDAFGIVVFRNEAIEVGWPTAARWGMNPHNATLPVVVSKQHPACLPRKAEATWLEAWWLARLSLASKEQIVSPFYRDGRWYHRAWRSDGGDGWRTYTRPAPPCSEERIDRWERRTYALSQR